MISGKQPATNASGLVIMLLVGVISVEIDIEISRGTSHFKIVLVGIAHDGTLFVSFEGNGLAHRAALIIAGWVRSPTLLPQALRS